MVGYDSEVVASREEDVALLDGPSNSETFKFDDCVSTLRIGEESGSGLNCFPFVIVLLHEYEPESKGASIGVEAGFLVEIKVGESWGSGEHFLSTLECLTMIWRPQEVVVGA